MAVGRSKQHGWLQEGIIRGSMLGKAIRPTDEELGKKDDDHKPRTFVRGSAWSFHSPLRWRRRRMLLAVVSLYLLYLLFNVLPSLRLKFGEFASTGIIPGFSTTPSVEEEPTGAPPGIKIPSGGTTKDTFAGQIRLYRLSASLLGASHTHGYSTTNRNVLFAISSLQSAAALLPMICEMSKWRRNWVHAAFMGRDDISIEDLLEINGVSKEECPAIWHDARPSYTEYSTERRAELSVIAALAHLHNYQHPQVIITNDALDEDAFFTKGVRSKASKLGTPMLEIPKGRVQEFMWITRLDAGSLRNWYKPVLDILIQVPSHSSGGVVQLLKSLRAADYTGLTAPRLTVELPPEVDITVNQYLENYYWPPGASDPSTPNQMTIRRRVSSQQVTQEESAIRFLELFYPTSTANSHVLLLSPQVQLSPLYLHYIKYVLLEYKYSMYGGSDAMEIMGAALDVPSTLLDGKTKLTPPKPSQMGDPRYGKLFKDVRSTPFLWQAPQTHATLFFGDKWIEFHSFLRAMVKKQHHQTIKKAAKPKIVSETLPAWTEYLLELMRVRGYSFLYPATSTGESFATVHNELYQPPEEFLPLTSPSESHAEAAAAAAANKPNEAFLRAQLPAPKPTNAEPPVIPYSRPLHIALPFEGDLPEVPHLPLMLYSGKLVDPVKGSIVASQYADSFRQGVGECQIPRGKHRRVYVGRADDLFCFGDEDEVDWADDGELEGVANTTEASTGTGILASSTGSATVSVNTMSLTPTTTELGSARLAAGPTASVQSKMVALD